MAKRIDDGVRRERALTNPVDPDVGLDGRHKDCSEEEYDAVLGQIVSAQRSEIEEDFAHGRTYTLDEWLRDDD